MDQPEGQLVNFTVGEVGDILKSKENLIYLFQISGLIMRFLFAAEEYVHAHISEGCLDVSEETHDDEHGCWHPKDSSNKRSEFLNHLARYQIRSQYCHLLSRYFCQNRQNTGQGVHV